MGAGPSRAQQPEMYDFWCAQACSFRAVLGLPIQTLTIATSAKRAEKIIYVPDYKAPR